MTPVTDYDVVNAMERFGGSFVRTLAMCYHAADPVNGARLKAAFPDVWTEYAELVGMIRHREQERHAAEG